MIYFTEAVGLDLVKIGFSERDPDSRLKELQTGCPVNLMLLGTCDGTIEDEQWIHAHLNLYRRDRSEWFFKTPKVLDFINACMKNRAISMVKSKEFY